MTSKKSALCVGFFLVLSSVVSFAADTVETQIKDKSDDAQTDVKKSVRKVKRKARKAKGTDTKSKDAQDKVNDAKDSVKNTGNKVENKLNE